MDATGLRVALFSGNYNYVRDGANQALNRFASEAGILLSLMDWQCKHQTRFSAV